MNEVLKSILLVLAGVLGTVLLYCLVVAIGCAVNGLTFGQQVCSWYGGSSAVVQQVAETVNELPIQ